MSYTPPPPGEAGAGGKRCISYVRLPIDNRPKNSVPKSLEMYRSLCVTGQSGNEKLKFVDVARSDGRSVGLYGRIWDSSEDDIHGQIKKGSNFTMITILSKNLP